MLATESVTLEEAIAEIDDRVDELNEALDELDADTPDAESLRARKNRLSYLRNGLAWQRDDWGGDTTIEVGALTAGEEAKMHREVPSAAEPKEMRLWFVAASTEAAPYVGNDLTETFHEVSGLHPAFVEWVESKANSLGVPSESGNRSSTSSTATEASETSTSTPDSTT